MNIVKPNKKPGRQPSGISTLAPDFPIASIRRIGSMNGRRFSGAGSPAMKLKMKIKAKLKIVRALREVPQRGEAPQLPWKRITPEMPIRRLTGNGTPSRKRSVKP